MKSKHSADEVTYEFEVVAVFFNVTVFVPVKASYFFAQ